jgi:hypothetical protein
LIFESARHETKYKELLARVGDTRANSLEVKATLYLEALRIRYQQTTGEV